MKIGTVTAVVDAEKKAECLGQHPFLKVYTGTEELIAADLVNAQLGQKVLLVSGNSAAKLCMDSPVDAAVIAILKNEAPLT